MSIFKFKLKASIPDYFEKWFKTKDNYTYFYIENGFYEGDITRVAYLLRAEYFENEEEVGKSRLELNSISRKTIEEGISNGLYIETTHKEVVKFFEKS